MHIIWYQLLNEETGKQYKIECERLEEAQLVWDSLVYLRNAYRVTCKRP
jgi:hypothetical protein